MTRTKPKGHRVPKRGAEEDHLDSPDSRRSKRRAADHASDAASVHPATTLSAEELFKVKNSSEFDDAEQDKDKHVEIKDEPTGDNQQPPSTAGPSTSAIHHARSPSLHTPAPRLFGDQSTQVVNREDLLDNLLSQDFNTEMTGYAVQQILQDARGSADTGNELGLAHVEVRIDRLQQKGIASSRLREVIQLFQTGLRDQLHQVSSRIESIGSVPVQPAILSAGIDRHALGQDKHPRSQNDSSVKSPQRGTIMTKAASKPAAKESRTPLAAFKASHRQPDSSGSSSDDDDGDDDGGSRRMSKQSRYLTDDDDDYRDDLDGDPGELTEEERSMLVVFLTCVSVLANAFDRQ